MNLSKLSPWNWFKKEEETESKSVPVGIKDQYDYPIERFHRDMDRLFDDYFQTFRFPRFDFPSTPELSKLMLKPSCDIVENDKEYSINVEIPGVDRKDVELSLGNGTLTIKGEKRKESEEKDKDYHRIERSYGSFRRVISLPEDADEEHLTAQFKNGVLKVIVPRTDALTSDAKKIEIASVG